MNSKEFEKDYFYERKEGHFCRKCRREFDYNSKYYTCVCEHLN